MRMPTGEQSGPKTSLDRHVTSTIFFVERFSTPTGPMLLLTDDEGRVRALEWADHEARMHQLLRLQNGVVRLELRKPASKPRQAVEAYFSGAATALDALCVTTGGTAFQREVWAELRTIPIGQTTTYGTLAARLGRPRAVRAVGTANGSNPISIIVPCHRVIGANASLTGYGGGLERKRWLLRHESSWQ